MENVQSVSTPFRRKDKMLKAGDVLDLSKIGTKFTIRKTAAETAGQAFEMEMEVGPHTGGTPLHTHPQADEIYDLIFAQP